MIYSKLESPHKPKERQTNSVTLLRRYFTGCQLEVSREANGRLRGWVITAESTEVTLKGLPAHLTFQRATQLFNQSYLKFQKEAIEVLPQGLGGGMKYSRPSSVLGSNKEETCEEKVLQLVEAISDDEERRVVREAVEGLLKNDPEKKDLNLSESQICNQIGDEGAQALGAALQVNQSIQLLNLERNKIGTASAQALGDALQVNQSIQKLELSHNKIGAAGAQALGDALQVNQSIQSLNLAYNNISAEGAQALGAALQVNQSIQELNLKWNQIGITGAQVLGAALQVNQSIQALNLDSNQIGAVGAQALGNALKVNQSIQELNLSGNQISIAGTQAIASALQVNQTIQFLNLEGNQLGNTAAQTLSTAFQVNHSIQCLNVDDNFISSVRIKNQIRTLLRANNRIATLFQQQITQVQNFLQSHENEDGIISEDSLQLKELLQKWHADSPNIIPSLEEILIQSENPNLNDLYKEKLKGIIKDLTNRLHELWIESFESKVAALSNEYVMGKESTKERNVDLGYALYDTWLTFLGSECPNWIADHLESFIPFGVLLDIAEGGDKKDVTELKDPDLLFQRVLSFRNESKDSPFSSTNQSQKS